MSSRPRFLRKIMLLCRMLPVMLAVAGCSGQDNILVYQSEFQTMGNLTARVSVYSSEAELTKAFRICKAEFDAVNKLCSLYDPESELSRINHTASSEPFVCSEEMWLLLMRSKQAYAESEGNFDITVKPLMDLWGFYGKRGSGVPSEIEIDETMKVVGFDKLILDELNHTVYFSVPGMALDMGGIAKGYAVDRAFNAMNKAGISSGVIDLAGNLRTLGNNPPEKNYYTVAIRDPHDKNRILNELLKVTSGMAVSTSGDYERFVTYNGKRYSHIISPLTGQPSTTTAVTVVAATAMDADIFSTACCMGGKAIAEKLRAAYPDTQIIFMR